MAKNLIIGFLIFTFGCVFLNAQTLDEAIRKTAAEMSEMLVTDSTVEPITPPLQPSDARGSGDSALPFKFTLGGVLGIFYIQGKENYADYMDSKIMATMGPTWNVIFLFPLENKLHFGVGGNLTVSFAFTLSETIQEDREFIYIPLMGTMAPYVIFGHNNAFLHLGYDFVLGALYISPYYKINEHLLIGLPMSLFGSSQRFSMNSLIQSSLDPNWESKCLQIGLSIQYVF